MRQCGALRSCLPWVLLAVGGCGNAQYDDVCRGGLAIGGEHHGFALRRIDGTLVSWGDGVPRPPHASGDANFSTTFVDATLCVASKGVVSCPFLYDDGLPSPIPADATDVSVWLDPVPERNPPSICAIDATGALTCRWDVKGTIVDLGAGFSKVAMGADHVCAIRADRTVFCQAGGTESSPGLALGLGDPWAQSLDSVTDAVDIVAADFASCARTEQGAVFCWGSFGSVGFHSDLTARLVALPAPADALVAGAEHACALVAGDVVCWGDNPTVVKGSPSKVPLPRRATTIASARDTVCAILDDTTVWCWGDSRFGELGDGTAGVAAGSRTPRPVLSCD